MHYMPYLFSLVFIGMWVLVLYITAKAGWEALAKKYEADKSFTGTSIGLISAGINGARYSGSLILKYNGQGMRLSTLFVFRLFHKPVFIPWNEIKDVRKKKIFLTEMNELIIGDPFVAVIWIRQSVFKKIENFILLSNYGSSANKQ